MADDARKLTAVHRKPEVVENRGFATARLWIAPGNAFDGDEAVFVIVERHGDQSG
jgi:hypothetical protein